MHKNETLTNNVKKDFGWDQVVEDSPLPGFCEQDDEHQVQ